MAETSTHALACLEVWGGSGSVAQPVELPGLDVWIYSEPWPGSAVGGDLYYLSVCSRGALARIGLADISGHGASASPLADCLRELMRRHINTFDQSALLRDLNRSFELNCLREVRFASILFLGIHGQVGAREAGTVVFSNAGQPRPLWYRARENTWTLLEESTAEPENILTNLPLGIIPGTDYQQNVVQLQAGDLLLLYTDGLHEARDLQGRLLGEEGLLALARSIPQESAVAAGKALLAAVRTFRGEGPAQDDETLLVLRRPDS
jgi:sigma-B regulation protein RsbU (phosphoserine phosphatase)